MLLMMILWISLKQQESKMTKLEGSMKKNQKSLMKTILNKILMILLEL